MEQGTGERTKAAQQTVGIDEWDAEGKRIHHGHAPLASAFQAAAEEFSHVWSDLALEQSAVAQLAQDFDGLVLRRRPVAKRVQQCMPDFVDGTLAIHAP